MSEEIREAMSQYALRVLRGDCTEVESAVLPKVLEMILRVNPPR